MSRRGGIAHGLTLLGQVLGDDAAQIIVVVVKDQHPICRHGAGEYILGRQYLRQIEGFSGYLEGRIKPLGPACPGRHRDVIGAKAQCGLGIEFAVGVHRHVAHLREGPHAVIANPSPGGHARELAFLQYPAAPVIGLLGDGDFKALLGCDQRGFQSGGAAAHHQHVARLRGLRKSLWVPAAAPFFARRGVLGAAHRHAVVPAGNADVAANALADVVAVAFADLGRQKGVGNAGSRATDQIEHAAANLRHHGVGRGKTAHADHRAIGHPLHKVDNGLMSALWPEARGAAVRGARIHFHVPQIGHVREQADHAVGFAFIMVTGLAPQFFKADAQRHRRATAGLVARHLQHFPYEAHAVLQCAAIAVVAVVVLWQQKLVAEVTHAGIHIKNVKACIEGASRCQSLPVQHLVDVSAGHFLGPQLAHKAHMRCRPRNARRGERWQARGAVHDRRATVPKLHCGEAPVAVNRLGG